MDNLENFIDPNLSGNEIHKLKLTGVQEAWHDNGRLCSRTHYKRGKLDGLYESWYDNGQQCELANYRRGKFDGVHLGRHPNGNVSEPCHYQNGLLHGEYLEYDESGMLQVHTHCYKGYENLSAWKESSTNKSVSPFTGKYEIWDDSLSPQPMAVFYMDKVSALEHQEQDLNDLPAQRIDIHVSESAIRPRKLTGVQEAYYDNGQISHRKFYKDGLAEGMGYSWHCNGQLKERSAYKAGRLDGVSLYYYDNGALNVRETYKRGKLDGFCEEWYDNGLLAGRCSYKAGKLDGSFKRWHENGQLKKRLPFRAGLVDGLSETWYPNGCQQTRWNYKDDKLDGLRELWDGGGNLPSQTHYKDNKKNGLHLDYDPESGEMYHWILFENDLPVKSGKPEELEQLEAYKNQAPSIVVPSSPVQEQAQAILNAQRDNVPKVGQQAEARPTQQQEYKHKL